MINSSFDYYYYYYLVILLLLLLFFWSSVIVHVSILFSAWQSTPLACSPPSSSIAFSTILESQEQENTNLNTYVRLYCHNLHSTKSYKPMWVLDGVPIIALMQLLTCYWFVRSVSVLYYNYNPYS